MGGQRSLKESLLDVAKLRTATVTIGGIAFTVREVGAQEFADYGVLLRSDKRKATAALIASCVVDENGQPVLTVDEALELANSARVATPIVNRVMQLSGFGEDDEKEPDAS